MTHLCLKQKALSASFASALLCGSFLWSPSCSTPPLTEIIVTVNSAFPDGDLDSIRLNILRDGDPLRIIDTDLDDFDVSFTQGVVHRGGPLGISITVQGIDRAGEVIVTQLALDTRFREGETQYVTVTLTPSCIGVACEAPGACVAGLCVSPSTDAGVADVGTPDAGPADSGLNARPLGECPAERIDITGDYICAADCPNCHLRCETGDCNVTCRSGASCHVESDGHNIVAECEEGSDCVFRTTTQGGVTARCSNANCDVDCSGDEACVITCPQGDCIVECNNNTMCRLRGCPSETCDADQLVCGRACP